MTRLPLREDPLADRRKIPRGLVGGPGIGGGGMTSAVTSAKGNCSAIDTGAAEGDWQSLILRGVFMGVGLHEYIVGAELATELTEFERGRAKGPISLSAGGGGGGWGGMLSGSSGIGAARGGMAIGTR